MYFLLDALLEIRALKHRNFVKLYFTPFVPQKEIWRIYDGVLCIRSYISNKRDLQCWEGVNENWILCFQFCMSENCKNFPQTGFWFYTFQTCFSSHCLHVSGASSCRSQPHCHWTSELASSSHGAGWVSTVGGEARRSFLRWDSCQ